MDIHSDEDRTLPIEKKVAIVGIGCRYPNGIKDVRDFWEVVKSGQDCMSSHPKNRLDPSFIYPHEKLPGKIYCRAAGYLSQDIKGFDRLFFQISPEEADHMDPQLRVLLEVVWESLADYGVNVTNLQKSNTGVYVGIMAKEYSSLLSVPEVNINKYTASGNNSNMMSNRISYQFDFRGPSITYDTACSSSLYAIHHACEAIRNGDCSLALAGGVNLLLLPSTFVALCQAGMLSPDGRCKSFDSSADGYARGEGAGMIVLKSLKEAIKDEDRIYAVIRGGALNNDGKTSGITAPSAESQMLLLRHAYEAANVSPLEVPYVEAHGTGTQAGDTVEATALGYVMAHSRGEGPVPLIVGSVKSNFGHTEGAAGVAGVIKTSLVLHKKQIPKLVHFETRNKRLNWDKFHLVFPTKLTSWPKGSKYIAGCSGFGFGGANAHLVLEAAPTTKQRCNGNTKCFPALLLMSAASKCALNQLASDWLKFLRDLPDDYDFWDIVLTAANRATHHAYRLAICCDSLEQSIEVIRARQTSLDETIAMCTEGRIQSMPTGQKQKLVFVFSGMGTQWWKMGRQLMTTNDVFKGVIMKADKLLKEFGSKWSLKYILTEETNKQKINNTEIAQPSICVLQIALVEVYRQLGVLPHAVIGHSVGEVAAACVSGYLTFRDAIKLIYIRGKTLQSTTGKGTMAAILSQANEVQSKLLELGLDGKVDIACVNSPTQTVISGNIDAVETLVKHFQTQGTRCVTLKVQNAFHSFQQEEVKKTFLKHTKFLYHHKPQCCNKYAVRQVPMMSTVTGEFLKEKTLHSNQYWWQNVRQTVEFETSLSKLFESGYNVFLEIGPHPSLGSAVKGTMNNFLNNHETSFHTDYSVIGSLKRPADLSKVSEDEKDILLSIAKLYVQGYPLNLEMLFPNESFKVASLPTYPWQRVECFAVTDAAKQLLVTPRSIHPLLGEPLTLYSDDSDKVHNKAWKSTYNLSSLPWLPHHKIENVIVLPGAAFIEIMLAVAKDIYTGCNTITLENVQFHKFHYSPECKGSLSTSAIQSYDNGHWQIDIQTYNTNDAKWAKNASCKLSISDKLILSDQFSLKLKDIQRRCELQIGPEEFYKKLSKNGIEIGNLFACISKAFYNVKLQEGLLYAALPETIENESNDYILHPGLLDATFQLFAGFSVVGESSNERNVEVPKSVNTLSIKGRAPPVIAIYGKLVVDGARKIMNLSISDAKHGKIFAKLVNVNFASVGSKSDNSGVQVWYKEWIPVKQGIPPLQDHANSPSLTSVENEYKEQYLIISDSVGVKDIFIHTLQQLATNKIEICDMTKDPDITKFQNQGGNPQTVVILTFMNYADISSLGEISRETFLQSQIKDVILLINTIRKLNSKGNSDKLSVWIITKSGVLAYESDTTVNPLMSSGYSLVMTFMHEFPELTVATIDLPNNQSAKDSMRWLSMYFTQYERSENCLALRPSSGSSVSGSKFQVFSVRLGLKSASELYVKKLSDKWMIDLKNKNKTFTAKSIKPMSEGVTSETIKSLKSSQVSVQINAFTRQYRKSISNPKEPEVGYLFGGTILESPNSNVKLVRGCKVLGYSRSNIVTSVVRNKLSEVVPIPTNVNLPEALFVVQTYFPLYLALKETFEMPAESVIIITSNDLNKHIPFGIQVALSTNIKVIIYSQDVTPPSDIGNKHTHVKVVTKESIHTIVENGSATLLLLHPDVELRNEEAELLLRKVRFRGTVAVLGDIPIKSNIIAALQLGVRRVEIEYMWASEHSDLRTRMLESLLGLFFTDNHQNDAISRFIVPAHIDEISDDQNLEGKLLLPNPSLHIPFSFSDAEQLFIADPNSSYLVVGGTKGLGFQIVQWLVSRGATSVFISSRNDPGKQNWEKIEQLQKGSISLKFVKCDVSDEGETRKMMRDIRDKGEFPLTGIFHCAAVFRDQLLENVIEEGWSEVLLPKAYGLLLLHQLTMELEMSLKMFVTISSIVEYVGNDGQGSYCSANAFVASICQERQLRGLPATVIAPGAISEIGYAAREGFDRRWSYRGIKSLSPSDVINSLSWSLVNKTLEFGLAGALDKETYIKENMEMFKHHVKRNQFSILKKEFPTQFVSMFTNESSSSLASLSASDAKAVVDDFLLDFLRRRLGISDDISTELSLSSLGFDSAMSWELSSLIRTKFNITVSSVELLNDSAKVSNICFLMIKRASNAEENISSSPSRTVVSSNTLWLNELREAKAKADLFCFPPTGKGATLFTDWAETFSTKGVRVIVAQLPGWEGRENEQASHDLGYLVKILSAAILSRSQSTRVAFFGSGIGSLLAFEIARYLQLEHDITINHLYISGWFPPSVPYPSCRELNNSDEKVATVDHYDETSLTFLDNRDLRQTHIPQRVYLNIKASKSICKNYRYVKFRPLKCNTTIFSGVRDTILTQKILAEWKNEIDPEKEFDNVTMPTDHKLLRNKKCNKNIASHVIRSLLKENATDPFNHKINED